jgi:hypothetical protein
VALDRALEALSDAHARDLDLLSGLERLDSHRLADGDADVPADLDEVPVRADAGFLQVTELGLRQLPLGYRLEGELDRVVAVGLRHLHLDDRAGAGLDHGHGRHHAGLRVEDLAHAQLASEDPFGHLRA